MNEHESASENKAEKLRLIESSESFEDLLMTNVLFVDFFNMFLQNPALGEILRFNSLSGDLEVIETEKQPSIRFANERPKSIDKTQIIKRSIESQLKAIIKNQTPPPNIDPRLTYGNTQSRAFLSNSFHNLKDFDSPSQYTKRQQELLNQVDNHSFKDLRLIEVKSNFNEVKNPLEKPVIPVVNNFYCVKTLKKPYSMKWLNARRLSLFLESELYLEFKLATLLSQYDLDNNDQESVKELKLCNIEVDPDLVTDLNPFKSKTDLEKLQQFYDMTNEEKQKVTERILQKSAGSTRSRQSVTNSPKLTKEKTFLTSVSSPKSKKSSLKININDMDKKKEPEPSKLPSKPSVLDDPNFETFKSIKDEKAKTRMVVINQEPNMADSFQLQKKKVTTTGLGDGNSSKNAGLMKKPILKKAKDNGEVADLNRNVTVKSVDEAAKILVDKVIEESQSQMNSPRIQKSAELMNIEQSMKYELSEKLGSATGKRARSRSRNSDREASAAVRSSSQASYYKNYQTDLFEDDFTSDTDSIKTEDEDVKVQLEDEPENSNKTKSDLNNLRQEEIEEFKTFLKNNSAYLYYKMWLDIEKIQFYAEDSEKQSYIKQLKFTYNRPLVLNRLKIAETTIPASNTDNSLVTKSKKRNYYNKLYEQYEKNIDFWSLENLKNNLQKSLLNTLITYWWPKYLMRMSDDYVKSKYPSYDIQRKMISNHKSSANDFNAKNIESTLKGVENSRNKAETNNFINPMTDSNQQMKINGDSNKKANSLNRMGAGSALSANRKQLLSKEVSNLSTKERKKEAAAAAAAAAAAEAAKAATKKEKKGPLKIPGLEMYDLVEDFRTGPPVGWKRPASTTSLMVRKMLENKQNNMMDAKRTAPKINKLDKEFYFEAIYRDDYGGQIFMKYLKSKHKKFAINRLLCLKELMKYKDLFYDDNFNQETVKLYALEIYKKHLAVSADYSIDCPKADRLKLYALFADSFNSDQIGVGNFVAYFKPVYEDTFISIEEYLLVSLYDDWRAFMEVEESFYNNNEIENIERKINIRSKKIDELINQGLVKIAPTQSHVNFGPDLRKDRTNLTENDVRKNEQRLLNSQWKESRASPNYSDLDHDNYHPPYSLKEVVANSNEYEMFKLFLQTNNAFFDILCWIDIEAYSQIDPEDILRIESHAAMLKRKYINKKYFFSQTGPVDQYTQNIILEKIGGWSNVLLERPPNSLIYLVKKYLERKLVNYWLPLYYNSEYRAKAVHQQRTLMNDVVNDVMFLKTNSQKIRQYSKIKRQRWLYSSQMVISFTKAIRSSFTTKLFHKFLSIKAFPNSANPDTNSFDLEMENNNMINNLQFLIDIQAYKTKHQQNTDNNLDREILFKMNHIIDTYINNRILPRIRIDISEELAKEILYQKDYLSPYLFLEAYLIIFNVLMPYWVEFNSMRSEKDLDIFDDTSCFKKTKNEPRSYGRPTTGKLHSNHDSMPLINDQSMKWRYNQYVKALKTQLVL